MAKTSPSRASRGKYCSRSCAVSATHTGLSKPKSRENQKAAAAALRGKPSPKRKPPVKKQCETCGQPFDVQPNRAATARFCSRACHHAWKRTVTGECHPLYRLVERPCEWCGKIVRVKPAKIGEFRFCSRRCHGSYTSNLFPKATSIEIALRDELTRRGIVFVPEYQVGQYCVDIALPEYQIAVEADGIYWHGNPKQQSKDRQKTGYLRSLGWEVLRFTETEIKADVCACVNRILAAIQVQQ